MENQNQEHQHNQDDVNPGSALKKLVLDNEEENPPKTEGTGGNRPIQTEGTVVIEESPED